VQDIITKILIASNSRVIVFGLWFLVVTENDLFPILIKPTYSSLFYRSHGFTLSLFSQTLSDV